MPNFVPWGNIAYGDIIRVSILGLSPRKTKPIDDTITLEKIRNIEMAAQGRFYTDAEGNAVYKSRYARNQ